MRLTAGWRGSAAAAALLFLLNAAVCREMFHVEYFTHHRSIEGAFIAGSRFLMEHPWDHGWFPLWYEGIPYRNTYPPLLHYLVAWAALLGKVSPARAYHALGGFFYCLGPPALFLLAYSLSGNRKRSLAAGLLVSLVSPSALLMPSVHQDMKAYWEGRRLQTLAAYGDAPHVAAIGLFLLAILALHSALDKRGPVSFALAAVAFAAVAATNWLGAFALALASLSYLLARSGGGARAWRHLATLAGVAALGYGLVAPWIPPSTILAVERNSPYVDGYFPMGWAQLAGGVGVLLALAGLRWAMRRAGASLPLQFGAYFLLLTGSLALTQEWLGVYIMPQPKRYHLEMEFAIALVLAFSAGPALWRAAGRYRPGLAALLLLGCVVQFVQYRRHARVTLRAADMTRSVEFEVADWLQRHLPGQRVFATGSIQFWLNLFSNNPQVGGGFAQGIIAPAVPVLHYGIPYTVGDGARAALLLRVLGAAAVVVSEPSGRDGYKEAWRDPEKFRGVLPELWRDGGEAIYGVPQGSLSAAHAVREIDLVRHTPVNAADVEPLRSLDAALLSPKSPPVEWQWQGPSRALLSASLRPDDVLLVQISYDAGWSAQRNGDPLKVDHDALGFVVLRPECSGPCRIELSYDGGREMRVARLARGASLAAVFLLLAAGFLARRRQQRTQQQDLPASARKVQ